MKARRWHFSKGIDCVISRNMELASNFQANRKMLIPTPEQYVIGNPMLEQIWKTLRKTDAKYRNFVENAVIGIFEATANGKYLKVNRAFANIYGYKSPDKFIASVANIKKQLYVAPNRHEELKKLLQENETVWRFESQVYRQDGSIIWVSENVRAIYNERGEFIGYEGTVEDITERKASEVALQATLQATLEKANAKNSFKGHSISMICHELRTPLTAILLSSELLRCGDRKMTAKEQEKYFDMIRSAVKNISEMLEGFLIFEKAESGRINLQKISIDIEEFCNTLWRDVKIVTNAKHQFVFSSNCQSVTLNTERTLLRQILVNLLLNAIKYSPKGQSIYLDLTCQDGELVIRVTDEGIGIPKSELSRLFEPFYRANNAAKYSGTGLGLAIVKKAVQLHKGQIFVESEVGQGTTFTIRLPILEFSEDIPLSSYEISNNQSVEYANSITSRT